VKPLQFPAAAANFPGEMSKSPERPSLPRGEAASSRVQVRCSCNRLLFESPPGLVDGVRLLPTRASQFRGAYTVTGVTIRCGKCHRVLEIIVRTAA